MKDGLASLLDRLAQIEGLKWLRFLYAYPNKITGRLLETIAKHDNICKYLDVPLQHASPAVLKNMKRGAGADIFLKTLEKVRATVPGIALRTSFIVGFPGETDADFEILSDFVREAKFDWLGVFNYSDEDGSKAFHHEAKLPERTIEARRRKLMSLQKGISKRAKKQWVGGRWMCWLKASLKRPHAVGGPDAVSCSGDRRQGLHQRFWPARRIGAGEVLSR